MIYKEKLIAYSTHYWCDTNISFEIIKYILRKKKK